MDGSFLRGPHKWVLLSTIGTDANNQIYSITYVVAEGKNKVVMVYSSFEEWFTNFWYKRVYNYFLWEYENYISLETIIVS